jgi:cytochrome c oxidase subunit 1
MKLFPGIHLLFAVTGFLLFVVSEVLRFSALDINFHDTYFVVSHWHISMAVFFVFSIFTFIYYAFAKMFRPLGKGLGYFHYVLSTFGITLFLVLPSFMKGISKRFIPDEHGISSIELLNLFITITALLFILAQLLFFINIGMTIFKKKA